MLKVSEIVRGGGTPFGIYRVAGGEPVGALEAEKALRNNSRLVVVPADEDTIETICAWHRQNGRANRAEQLAAACGAKAQSADPGPVETPGDWSDDEDDGDDAPPPADEQDEPEL